jgi:putative flippase GtrA
LLVFLTEVGALHYLISSCISYSVGAVAHYFISTRWVFDAHRLTDKRMEFAGFVGIGLSGLALTQILLWFAVAILGINYQVGKVLTTGFSFVLNFAARKLLLFTV